MAAKASAPDTDVTPDILGIASDVTVKATVSIDADLQTALDLIGTGNLDTIDGKLPIQQGTKMVRRAFQNRRWPDEKHPGTVFDFLVEHGAYILT